MAKSSASHTEKEMSFLDHLEELRWHIIRSLIAIVIFAIAFFIAKFFVFDTIIFGPINKDFLTYRMFCAISETTCIGPPENLEIIPRELGERFFTHLKVSFWLGFICAFPVVLFEVWRFIKPGLYKSEQKAARGMVLICTSLFYIGVLFGYFIIAPFALKILGGYTVSTESVIESTSLASYVNTLTVLSIPTGLIFELPVIIYFLSKIGLVYPDSMKKYRRHALVVILIFAAIITPPDVITQFLIGIPIYFLYEASIIISRRVVKKNES